MKKILIVVPKDSLDLDPMVYPPLGLLYIAAVLEKDGHEVNVFDMRKDNNIENIPKADFYCFSATTPQIENEIKVSKYVKGTTIIGGAHASWEPDSVKKHFDSVVIGEGDNVILDIVNKDVRGIINANKTKKYDINEIPFPARHLMDNVVSKDLWEGYMFRKPDSPIATTLITSRGCPWRCSFCANLPQSVRFRSVENVVEEIKQIIKDYSCSHFRFLDDNFINNKSRFRKIAKQLKDLNISYRCSARSDLLDSEICGLLVSSGCKEIGFGIESGDDNVLKLIHKNERVIEHKRAIKLAKSFGIKTKAFLMAGLPGETWESIEMTKQFIEEVKPDKWIATLFTPFPGSPIYRNPADYKVEIVDKNFTNFVQSYPSKSVMKTDVASREELGLHYEELIRYLKELYNV